MGDRPLRIGTRGSALALAQTGLVAERLGGLGLDVEIVRVRTEGDRAQRDRSMMLGRGAFVKELERALLEGEIDLAVHSAKDMPTDAVPGTVIAAFPTRQDPHDVLVSRDGGGLAALARGARVGTESPRRRAFLLAARADLEVLPIRGNVDTRLRKLDDGEYDALVVAAAGLLRLGLDGRVSEILSTDTMLPAVGQGALAIQTRVDDPAAEAVRPLDDGATRSEVVAERAFLATMGGGCRAPFAALARAVDGTLAVEGAAIEPDGAEVLRERVEGPAEAAADHGRRLAGRLLDRGAARFAEGVRP